MATIPGSVAVTGFLAPTDSNDVFPVTNPTYGLGGWRKVSTLAERDAIPVERREEGMGVYVVSEQSHYVLNNDGTTWKVFGVSTSQSEPIFALFPSPWMTGDLESLPLTDKDGNSIYI